MKFTLTANAPVEVPDVDAICLKNVKKVDNFRRRATESTGYFCQRAIAETKLMMDW